MLNPQNISLVERAKYFPDTLDRETLIDALTELEAWRNAIYKQASCDTPEEACDYMDQLSEECVQKGVRIYDLECEIEKLKRAKK